MLLLHYNIGSMDNVTCYCYTNVSSADILASVKLTYWIIAFLNSRLILYFIIYIHIILGLLEILMCTRFQSLNFKKPPEVARQYTKPVIFEVDKLVLAIK